MFVIEVLFMEDKDIVTSQIGNKRHDAIFAQKQRDVTTVIEA